MPTGSPATSPFRTTLLHNAQVMSVEQITLPDPTNANQYVPVQRIALVYDSIDRTQYPINADGTLGTGITSSQSQVQTAPVSLPSVDTCKSSYTDGPMFMKLGNVKGDVLVTGEENTIAVYDVCSAIGNAGAAHASTGAGSGQLQSDSIAIVKKVERCEPGFASTVRHRECHQTGKHRLRQIQRVRSVDLLFDAPHERNYRRYRRVHQLGRCAV